MPLLAEFITNMKKKLILFLVCGVFLSLAQTSFQSGKNLPGPYKYLKYDKVIAYDYFSNKNIVEDGKLNESLIKKKVILTSAQIDTLHSFIFNIKTYGALREYTCYRNCLGIVYYLNNNIVAHMSVSIECNYLSSSLNIPAMEYSKVKNKEINQFMNANGFSKIGRMKINQLSKELKFSCYNDSLKSKWDK